MTAGSFYLGTGHQSADQVHAVLDTFYETGGRDLDTARVYGDNEGHIGSWLRSRGVTDMRILTKGGHPDISGWQPPEPPDWKPRLDDAAIRADIEQSLTDLGVASVESYLLHRDQLAKPISEIAATLSSLVAEGLTRTIGVSNWRADRVAALIAALDEQGGPPLAWVSNYFGLARAEGVLLIIGGKATTPGLIDLAEHHQFRILGYQARSFGFFDREERSDWEPFAADENRRRKAVLYEVAARHDVDPSSLLTRWLITVHPKIVPVFGTRRPDHVRKLVQTAADESLDASAAELTEAVGGAWQDAGEFRAYGESGETA